jgi:hypothetical protein
MDLDLQSLFGLHVHSCTHWLRPRTPPPPPRHLGSYTRALLVSQNRRHLFVTPRGGVTRVDEEDGAKGGRRAPPALSKLGPKYHHYRMYKQDSGHLQSMYLYR